jgi:uncharacterized membrane protein YdbT with pleckstrin-like domain
MKPTNPESQNPMNEEQTVWKGTSSQSLYLGTYTLCLLFCWLIVPIFYALWKWYMLRSREYEVTTERIRIRSGIFSKRTEELELYRVKDYALVEPFWLRLFKAGNIQLATHDESNPLMVLEAVPNAAALRDEIRKNVELCRGRKRVRLAELE